MMDVSDVSTDVGVRLWAVKPLLTNIYVSCEKWNIRKMLRSVSMIYYLLIPSQVAQSSEKGAREFTFSKTFSNHSRMISLILLHMIAKWLITLSFSTSLGSAQAYHICIQIVVVIFMHPYQTLPRPLPDSWFSIFVRLVPRMHCAFSLDTDLAMTLQGTRTRASTNRWDMIAQDAVSCLCDEYKHLVNKSRCLDDDKQILS